MGLHSILKEQNSFGEVTRQKKRTEFLGGKLWEGKSMGKLMGDELISKAYYIHYFSVVSGLVKI